jgi:hypothetical protein
MDSEMGVDVAPPNHAPHRQLLTPHIAGFVTNSREPVVITAGERDRPRLVSTGVR